MLPKLAGKDLYYALIMRKGDEMKIKVIGVVPITDEYVRKHLLEPGEEFFNSIKEPGTEIDFAWPTKGIQIIDQFYGETLNSTYVMQLINEVDESVYDGVIIWCAGDPCLAAAKERLNIPVVGLLQSSLALASCLGRRVGIVAPKGTSSDVSDSSSLAPLYIDKARVYGMDKNLVSIRSTSLSILDFDKTVEEQQEAALVAARQAVEEDGADVLILGCGGMMETAQYLQEKSGVPVIDPNVAGLSTLEMLVKMRLSQSKKAYPRPNLEAVKIVT